MFLIGTCPLRNAGENRSTWGQFYPPSSRSRTFIMSLARLPMRIAAVLAQRGARVAEGPSAQKTISQNQRAAEATQRFFFFRSGVCSSKAVICKATGYVE